MEEDILNGVSERLRPGRERELVLREIKSHLLESVHDLELSGSTPDQATRETVRRFGDPGDVGELLRRVHRRNAPTVKLVLAATLALAAISAAFGAAETMASTRHRLEHHQRTGQAHLVVRHLAQKR